MTLPRWSARPKLDTRTLGLDASVSLARWLTGSEHLHYGLWTGLDPVAGNVGAAQEAYTRHLFGHLPEGPLTILDIGGGAGETARRLGALGHQVEIVVPSAFLAERCRKNAPDAQTHLSTFQDFETDRQFDLCLFSESFQYIPLTTALEKAQALTRPGGHILIADCFRSEAFQPDPDIRKAGGGHPVADFKRAVEAAAVSMVSQEDITTQVAPSIDVEQSFYNMIGGILERTDAALAVSRPRARWIIARALRLLLNERRRMRLTERLHGKGRTAAAFEIDNCYLVTLLRVP